MGFLFFPIQVHRFPEFSSGHPRLRTLLKNSVMISLITLFAVVARKLTASCSPFRWLHLKLTASSRTHLLPQASPPQFLMEDQTSDDSDSLEKVIKSAETWH